MAAEVSLLREALDMGDVHSLRHIATEYMLADGLTKVNHQLKLKVRTGMSGTVQVPEWTSVPKAVSR